MPRLDGFDVYHGNGNPFAWADMVNKYGIKLGCCKVSESVGFVDPAWAANRAAMNAAGLRYMGLYHWLAPDQPLDAQLRNFQRIGTLRPGEFTMLDIEPTPGKVGPSKQMCLDACALWEQTYPGRFIRYQGKYFADGDSDAYAPYLWWLAYYGPASLPSTHLPVTVWQWGGGALGIEHFDSNQIIDLDAVERLAGYQTAPPAPSEEQHDMAYFRDDRADGWQIWVVSTDAVGNVWTCPITDLPDRGKWELVQPILGDPPVKPLGALVGLMDAQNRPQLPAPSIPSPTVPAHTHVPGGVA